MAHDPSICDCSKCKECKSRFVDNFETRYCKKDGKPIEFWGEDICPIDEEKKYFEALIRKANNNLFFKYK